MGSNSASASSAMEAADAAAPKACVNAPAETAAAAPGGERVARSTYLYPGLGDRKPAGGEDVTLLTTGGVAVRGCWSDDGRYLGWAPLPARDRRKEALLANKAGK
jgi:hypothetical protein